MEKRQEIYMFVSELEKRLQKVTKELAEAPEGCLHQIHSNKGTVFKQATIDKNGVRCRKSIMNNPSLMKRLARKEYLQTEARVLRQDLDILHRALQRYIEPDAENILMQLPKRFHTLPKEWFWFQSPESKLKDKISCWADAPYQQSDYKPEKKNKRTSRGLLVRSMGEVVCAERFYHHEIAFRYEQVIQIDGYSFAPDFTIMRPRDGKIIYWEHCGKPYDSEYMEHHNWKLKMYEKAGIVPWDNLIVTYSDENNNSDVKIIESEIINKLL